MTPVTYKTDSAEFEVDGWIRKITANDGTVLLEDRGGGGYHINDPRAGGGGSVGFCYGEQNGHYDAALAAPTPKDAAPEWYNCTWDITTSMPYQDGFGCGGSNGVLWAHFDEIAEVQWRYGVHPDRLEQQIVIDLFGTSSPAGSFFKEPKIAVDGVNARWVEILRDPATTTLVDMDKFPDPHRKTRQVPYVLRGTDELRRLSAYNIPTDPELKATRLEVEYDRGLDDWAELADVAEPFVPAAGPNSPVYCLQGGRLKRQAELIRFKDDGRLGMLFHGWEGGFGQVDCLPCYRKSGPETFFARLTYRVVVP